MSNTNVDLQAPADPDEWLASSDQTKSPTAYSLNISILTTAVLSLAFVLAFLLFLHLYIRYVLRRSRHRQSTTTIASTTTANTTALRIGFAANNNNNDNNDEPPKRPGLDPSAIAALPSFLYAKRSEAVDCAVCLSAVEAGETVRCLPGCGHVFHVRCIDAWLETNSSCPVCREGVEPPPVPVSMSADVVVAGDAAVGGKEEAVGSVSARLSSSLRRMLSRERSGRGAAVAAAGDIPVEDLEGQQ